MKQSILAAGVMLLRDKGIAALTQPQVANAAGVKQSHLTYYFPTRADLLLGIAEHAIDAAVGKVAAQPDEPLPHDQLAATIAEEMIAGVPPRAIIGLIVAADAEPAIRKPLNTLIEHVRGEIHGVLMQSRLTANPDAALLFHATVVGLAIMHQARQTSESAAEIRSGVAAMLRLLEPPAPAAATKES